MYKMRSSTTKVCHHHFSLMTCHEILSRNSISHALGGVEPVRRATCAPACAGWKTTPLPPPKKKLPWLGKSLFSIGDTPRKINMEPKNHPIVKENHLPKHHFSGSILIFQGVHRLKWLVFSIVISVSGLETFNLRKLSAFSPELDKWRKCNHTGE